MASTIPLKTVGNPSGFIPPNQRPVAVVAERAPLELCRIDAETEQPFRVTVTEIVVPALARRNAAYDSKMARACHHSRLSDPGRATLIHTPDESV